MALRAYFLGAGGGVGAGAGAFGAGRGVGRGVGRRMDDERVVRVRVGVGAVRLRVGVSRDVVFLAEAARAAAALSAEALAAAARRASNCFRRLDALDELRVGRAVREELEAGLGVVRREDVVGLRDELVVRGVGGTRGGRLDDEVTVRVRDRRLAGVGVGAVRGGR